MGNLESTQINFDDFSKVEIRVGEILSAEKVPETDKLLRLSVDFGKNTKYESLTKVQMEERDIRQIISGIALHFPEPSVLVGKRCMFVTNLEPRVIRGFPSNGMLFAVSSEDGKFSLLEPNKDILPGTIAK